MFFFLFKWKIIIQTTSLTPKPDSNGPASCSCFLSISVKVREVSMRGRNGEREEVWGVALCLSFLAGASQGNRARLIIIKTHTTWHVYLMAAPGKDGKLLLSLTVTCWSTTVPCVSVWRGESVGIILYVPLTSCVPVNSYFCITVRTSGVCYSVLYTQSQGRPLCVWIKWIGLIVSHTIAIFTQDFTVSEHAIQISSLLKISNLNSPCL